MASKLFIILALVCMHFLIQSHAASFAVVDDENDEDEDTFEDAIQPSEDGTMTTPEARQLAGMACNWGCKRVKSASKAKWCKRACGVISVISPI